MQTEFITITEYCTHHHTDIAFVEALGESGLVNLIFINGERSISYDQLPEIEGYTRLHDELNINLEGIDTIRYLLEKLRDMQQEITALKSRLKIYE